jgi:hypothetical protein
VSRFWTPKKSAGTVRARFLGPRNGGPMLRPLFWEAPRRAGTVRSRFLGSRKSAETIRPRFLGVRNVTRTVRSTFGGAKSRAQTISPHFLGARKAAPIVRPRFWGARNRAPTLRSGLLGTPEGDLEGPDPPATPDYAARPGLRGRMESEAKASNWEAWSGGLGRAGGDDAGVKPRTSRAGA